MSDILNIPDILVFILKYTDRKTDARCARVSKAWHEPSLDSLWYHFDHLKGLFVLLCLDMAYSINPDIMDFSSSYIPSDRWERFFFYAKRIKHLECNDTDNGIHHSAFATLSFFRPVLHILPNLTHLTWRNDPSQPALSLKLCLLFLAPGLKSLTVRTGLVAIEGDLFAIGNFFQEVAGRCPQLEHIDFSSLISFRDMGPMFPKFIGSFSKLKTVSLPEGLICSDVVTMLATSCLCLEGIRCTTPKPEVYRLLGQGRDVLDLENFMPYVGQHGFRSIRTLHLTAHLWNVTRFLLAIPTISQVCELVVRTLTLESAKNVEGFFTTVSALCPKIEVFSISIQSASMQQFEVLPFSSIAPLLTCRSLISLSIESPSMLDIDDAEAVTMASSWPQLEELHLNPLPVPQAFECVSVTFATLAIFAELCPKLQYLGICSRASFVLTPETRRAFPRLKQLVLGIRDMDYNQDAAALYLADILPPTCTLATTQLFSVLTQIDRKIRDHFSHSQWKAETTIKKVPVLRNCHMKYKERLRTLEGEVQKLTIAANDISVRG
ncbi:hypothetical protein BDZ94DRAFT_1215043 [Collybia nuda]|uniref:F-box domain-containing protein n=1 Tax=Collybia nuda TaxID=64659 RepID=A0A9P5YB49_9AGAR|nr:hypothetical protein BDZ94DRAFT_1215043 [Collybia nuda]